MNNFNIHNSFQKMIARKQELEFINKKSLGQNFLINDFIIKKIIKKVSDLKNDYLIIEIGPGLGALTDYLSNLKRKLILIENDETLGFFWKQKGYEVIMDDALQIDWNIFSENYVLVSNLPYQIAASIVIERTLDQKDFCQHMVLMFQKEVADRIKAQVGNKEFGFLSVLVQTFWKVTKLLDAKPKDFYPPPKVLSSVLFFERKSLSLHKLEYFKFIKGSFISPRKTLLNNWEQGLNVTKEDGLQGLQHIKIHPKIRPHEIDVSSFQKLFAWWQDYCIKNNK